jgi:hypothetical protein
MKAWPFLLLTLLVCCKSKKKEEPSGSFPVLPYIQSQVAQVDTSLFNIMKVVTVDSTSDTTYIRREDFRKAAQDFLSLPDISSPRISDGYTEDKSYDQLLELAVLTYTPKADDKNVDDKPVRKEQVFIEPGNGEPDLVKKLIIDVVDKGGMQKNLIWNVGSNFQVVSATTGPDGREKLVTTRVSWK